MEVIHKIGRRKKSVARVYLSKGKGTYTMEFSNYEQVPAHIAQKIVDEKVNEEEMAGAK